MRLESLCQDVAFVYRSYRRQPGVALTAFATLTLGIGACTAIFSVMNAVLLKPVSYPDPDRIVMVGTNTAASAPKLAAWRQQTDVFTQLSAYRGGVVNITVSQEVAHGLALQVPYAQADVNFFALFGRASRWAAASPVMTIARTPDEWSSSVIGSGGDISTAIRRSSGVMSCSTTPHIQ
jgi:hypothetical protein